MLAQRRSLYCVTTGKQLKKEGVPVPLKWVYPNSCGWNDLASFVVTEYFSMCFLWELKVYLNDY